MTPGERLALLDGLAPRLLAAGMLGMGLQSLILRDMMQAWQPVPADLPARALLAMANGALTALLAGAILVGWRRRTAGLCLAGLMLLWLVAMLAPSMAGRAGSVGAWLAVAEVAFVMFGAVLIASEPGDEAIPAWLRAHGPTAARVVCGLALLVFGLAHFVYAEITAGFVPAWLPERLFLAYLTGACHVAAGLGLLSGVLMTLSMRLETLMMGSFLLLVHVPRVIATGGDKGEVKLLFAAMALSGAAWVLASNASRGRLGRSVLGGASLPAPSKAAS